MTLDARIGKTRSACVECGAGSGPRSTAFSPSPDVLCSRVRQRRGGVYEANQDTLGGAHPVPALPDSEDPRVRRRPTRPRSALNLAGLRLFARHEARAPRRPRRLLAPTVAARRRAVRIRRSQHAARAVDDVSVRRPRRSWRVSVSETDDADESSPSALRGRDGAPPASARRGRDVRLGRTEEMAYV